MDPYSGQTYASLDEAKAAKADLESLVWMEGKPEHIEAISDAVKAQRTAERRKKNKAAKASRKRNR